MLERRFRRSRVRVNFVLIWHHLAQRRGIRGRSCRIATNWVSAKLSDGNRFNIAERVGTAICQAAKFPERLA
jgi:hypothetical protein